LTDSQNLIKFETASEYYSRIGYQGAMHTSQENRLKELSLASYLHIIENPSLPDHAFVVLAYTLPDGSYYHVVLNKEGARHVREQARFVPFPFSYPLGTLSFAYLIEDNKKYYDGVFRDLRTYSK